MPLYNRRNIFTRGQMVVKRMRQWRLEVRTACWNLPIADHFVI